LGDGNLEFLGRIDFQVKIRGIRIEPGEIEHQLLKHEKIKEAVVMCREDRGGEKYLCTYILPEAQEEGELDIQGLRDFLSGTLPGYMVPHIFVPLERLPLTQSGKIDRKALPGPGKGIKKDYTAPRHPLEKQLAAIWSEVLLIKKDTIGIDSNFFELGGHSLKATRLVSKIHKELNVKLPLEEIFAKPTVRGLSDYLAGVVRDRYVSMKAVEAKEYYEASSAQKRLYFLHQLDRDSVSYNMPALVSLEKDIEKDRLETIFRRLIQRHESFRTFFEIIEGKPVQRVHDVVEFAIEYHSPQRDMHPRDIIDHFIKPFDLSHAPLMRVGLIDKKEENILILDMHHIISDGASGRIFIKEFSALYKGEDLPSLRVQYKEYSEWQGSEEQTQTIKRQEQYWQREFEVEPPVLTLPADYVRPMVQKFEGSSLGFIVGPEETGQLNALALKEETTMFMVLLAIFNVLLAKLSGQQDIVVGTGIEGRRHEDLHQVIGMFVNTLALRSHPQPGISFLEFLKQVKKTTLEAYENQDYQFENLVEQVFVRKDTSRNPLFDVMFQLDNLEKLGIASLEPSIKPYPYQKKISKFDMTLFAKDAGKKLLFFIEYSTALFKKETVQWFATFFKEILKTVSRNPAGKLAEIMEMPEERKKTILDQLNQELNREVNIIKKNSQVLQIKWEKHINTCKDKIAIQMGARAVTYDELDRRANHMANWMIHNRTIAKGTFIGILMDNRLELIVTVMGILKAGAVMVPLDPGYPGDRLELMLNSTDVNYIIGDNVNLNRFLAGDIFKTRTPEFIPVEKLFSSPASSWLTEPPGIRHQAEDSIYIYFTSGSTGIPRAMIGKNSGLVHFIDWEIDTFGIDDTSRISQLTTPAFDAFLRDVFVPLLSGGVICIPGNIDTIPDPDELIAWIDKSGIRLIHCVPGLFRLLGSDTYLTNRHFKALKYVLLSGEPIHPPDLTHWFDIFAERILLFNLWGTSETTLAKTCHLIRRSDIQRERIPVGQPIPGARLVVLDNRMNPCPGLITGEIYIVTPFRTAGYCNNPELTGERFLPFTGGPRVRMHKTGDLGRLLPGGYLELLGRNDRQVKIRGIRVELEEIESLLVRHALVNEAVVVKREISGSNELLCAYVVLNDSGEGEMREELLLNELERYLTGKLPAYMVPARIISIETLPRTSRGKVDDDALPDPFAQNRVLYIPPRDELEKSLCSLWSEILKIDIGKISVTHSFFELGGNSLNGMALVTKIHKAFNVKFPLAEIFVKVTIQQQAECIRKAKEERFAAIESAEKKEYYPLSSAQKRMYFLYRMEPESKAYNMPRTMVLEGDIHKEPMEETFRKLIRRHESFRTSFEIVEARPVQRIHREVPFGIDYFEAEEEEADTIVQHYLRPFELNQAPILRVGLIRIGEERYILIVEMHHIISDGTSMVLFVNEFMALSRGEKLPFLRIQYKDFSEWRNSEKEQKKLQDQETYWLKEFEEIPPPLNLSTDYRRPSVLSFEGDTTAFDLGKQETGKLKTLALKEGATMYMVLLTICNILLSKLSGKEDILIGTGVEGRRHEDLRHVIGMFVNTLALRNYPKEEKTFNEFLREVKERTLKAFENQDYQFEDLVDKVTANRNPNRNPLFDLDFQVENVEKPKPGIADARIRNYGYQRKISRFDLTLRAFEIGDQLRFTLEYSTKLFKAETIQWFMGLYKDIAAAVVEDPDIELLMIGMMAEKESGTIMSQFTENLENE
jgi:amino acid adenylation domain-containing protein